MNSIGKSVASIKEQRCDARPAPRARRIRLGNSGFSMVELIVVVGIIALLAGLLIPTIKRIRVAANIADTQAQINNIASACERYFADFRAYPGPLPNSALTSGTITTHFNSYVNALPDFSPMSPLVDAVNITGSENLTLGLLGGLQRSGGVMYDPRLVGTGAKSLGTGTTITYPPYIDAANLSWRPDSTNSGAKTGRFQDSGGSANDSVIPEFVDKFPAALPILYLRAKVGATSANYTSDDNPVCTDDQPPGAGNRNGAYDVSSIIGYTNALIGEGRTLPNNPAVPIRHGLRVPAIPNGPLTADTAPDAQGRYTPFLYMRDASSTDSNGYFKTPKKKDSFILISAGPDRVYGTKDDITNFGSP